MNSLTDEEWFEMVESLTDEEWEQICRELAADGLIYDTGERKWSERTKSYQVAWAFVPPKHQQS